MTRQAIATLAVLFGALAAGCGGSDKEAEEPAQETAEEPELDTGDEMIDPDIFDSIRNTFERKQTVVARCFVEGVEAGEIKSSAKGHVTVVATILPSGSASEVEVSEASLKSPAVHKCITDLVESWAFVEPPRPVKQSFTYVLGQL